MSTSQASQWYRRSRRPLAERSRRGQFRALLERLEDRHLLALFMADDHFIGGGGDQAGTDVTISGSQILLSANVVAAQSPADLSILARFNAPTTVGSVPAWQTAFTKGTTFGVAADGTSVYGVGWSHPGSGSGTVDGVGGTEVKAIVTKSNAATGALDTTLGPLSNGISYPPVGFNTSPGTDYFLYDGVEAHNDALFRTESGTPYVYAVGGGQPCSYSGYVVGKYNATSGALTAAATDSSVGLSFGTCYVPSVGGSDAQGIAELGGNLFLAGSSSWTHEGDGGTARPNIWRYNTALGLLSRTKDSSLVGGFNDVTSFGGAIYAVGQTGVGGSEDYLIQKFDAAGVRLWSTNPSEANSQRLLGVIGLGTKLYAVGYSNNGGAGGEDAVVLEIDPATGGILSTTKYGGTNHDRFNSVATDGVDLYAVGESRSYTVGGNGVGQNDAVLVRYTVFTPTPMVVDDPVPGAGYVNSTGPGYLGDAYYAPANSGTAATWTYSGLAAGVYQVAVTWPNSGIIGAPGNLASNATYTLTYGGGSKTLVVDQRELPNDFNADGAPWEEFVGRINHSGGNLTVSLPSTGINGQYVYADAVRVIQLVAPEIQVAEVVGANTTNTASGATTLSYPTTYIRDSAPTKTLRIENVGTGTLTSLPATITPPAGFKVFSDSGVGTTTLASGATRTVILQMNTDPVADLATPGAKSGTLTIASSDADEAPYALNLAGFVESRMIVDNAQPMWYTSGRTASFVTGGATWSNFSQGFLNQERYVAANVANTATFTVSGLPAGKYRVSTTWKQNAAFAATTQFVVNSGTPVAVNQSMAPVGFTETLNGKTATWQDLVSGLTVSGGTITVVVQIPATVSGKYMTADAIRVEWQSTQLADAPPAGAATGQTISAADTGPLLAEAVRRWSEVDPTAAARLAQVQVLVQPLSAGVLGLASPITQHIWLNSTAAGHGWYVDATPQWDDELSGTGSPLAGYDLLSTLAHELGHLLGYGDVSGSHAGVDPMAGELAAGLRSLPAPGLSLDTLPTRNVWAANTSPVTTADELRLTPRAAMSLALGRDALFADLGLTDWANVAGGERPTDPGTASGHGRRKDRWESQDPREARDALFAHWEEL